MSNEDQPVPKQADRRERVSRRKEPPALGGAGRGFAVSDNEPRTFGVAWPVLRDFRSRLADLPLPHEYVLPFAVFLGGLTLAMARQGHQPPLTQESAQSGLAQAARETLRDAIEFALQEEAQSLVRSNSNIPGDTAYQCLFMGVAYAQTNHTSRTHAWLEQGSFQDNLTRLLLAMGMLSLEDAQARRLTRKIRANLHALAEENFGPEVARLLGDLRFEPALRSSKSGGGI